MAQVIGAVFEPKLTVEQYALDCDKAIGCTTLIHGFDTSTAPPVRVTAKTIQSSNLQSFIEKEGKVQYMLNSHPHKNLPKIVNSIETEEGGYLIMQPYFGDLHSYVRAKKRLSEDEAKVLFRQIVAATSHCHHLHIALRDIKLGKIMFASQNLRSVVIGDLDGSQVLTTPLLKDQKGSPAYVSPEVLANKPYDGLAADVWSLGVVLYVMLTGCYPFQDANPGNLFRKIMEGKVLFPSCVSKEAQDFVLSMLQRDPLLRPSAVDILSHSWLAAPESDASSSSSSKKSVTSGLKRRAATKVMSASTPAGVGAELGIAVGVCFDDQVVPNIDTKSSSSSSSAMDTKEEEEGENDDQQETRKRKRTLDDCELSLGAASASVVRARVQ